MLMKSNESMASIALQCAGELWGDMPCAICGKHGIQLHEIAGRQYRKYLGALDCILGLTLIPVCPKCHIEIENKTMIEQISIAQNKIPYKITQLQIEAIKARC